MLEHGKTNVLVTVGSKIGAKLLGPLMVNILKSVILPHSIVVMMVKLVLAILLLAQIIHLGVIHF
jgi:hypothetical protein